MTDLGAESRSITIPKPYVREDPYPLFVDGAAVHASEHFDAIDPSRGRRWARVAQASAEHVERAVASARTAARTWRRVGPAERHAVLDAIADRLEEDPDFPVLLATENGRPLREAEMADVPTAVAVFRYYGALARGLHGEQVPTDDPEVHVWTAREPIGVVAALIPWNSPLISTALKVAPALAAGNSVVLKPSEFAASSVVEFGLRTADIIPPGVLNVVTGFGPSAGAALVSHPGVGKISFTGGVQTARQILRSAAEYVTPALMELGGKSAFVICPDADLELAVEDALKGIAFQNGQVCFAASRLFLHADIRDAFLERFIERMGEVRIGDAVDPATQMGPLVSDEHRNRVADHVERAVEQGATVLTGGRRLQLAGDLADGYFFEPTVVDDPRGQTQICREEVFGPVTAVQIWDEESDVIERANGTDYGLAAGVWTRDLARAHRFCEALEAGTVWVNTWFDVTAGQPLGGVKASGYGREMCAETMLEYTAPKAIAMRFSSDRPALWG
jgi:acyl-CoA reductase-like NAD-dependent aldehyde dehydrogenase